MWAKDRHHRIVALLATCEQVSLENLATELGVSRETLRRDVVQLESEGRLKRVHGGFMRPDAAEPPFQRRMGAHAEAKQRIGAAAARLVKPGMLIAVDAGSTTSAFAQALTTIPQLTVVTNSLQVATALQAGYMGSQVIVVGGVLAPDVPGTYGEMAIAQLQRFAPQLAFFSPVAVDAALGVMDYDLAEAEFARAMVACAQQTVVLADHTKLGIGSRVRICSCETIHTLVTDRKAPAAQLEALARAGISHTVRA